MKPAAPAAWLDGATISTGWQPVEVARLGQGSGSRPVRTVAKLTVTWGWGAAYLPPVETASPASAARPAIPRDAFVVIGRNRSLREQLFPRRARLPRPVPKTADGRGTANDNAEPAGPRRGRVRGLARDIVFLAILAATLFGAYQTGRLATFQNVIVVPESALPSGRVT